MELVLLNKGNKLTGQNEFTKPVIIPAATADTHAVNKGQVDTIVEEAIEALSTSVSAEIGDLKKAVINVAADATMGYDSTGEAVATGVANGTTLDLGGLAGEGESAAIKSVQVTANEAPGAGDLFYGTFADDVATVIHGSGETRKKCCVVIYYTIEAAD